MNIRTRADVVPSATRGPIKYPTTAPKYAKTLDPKTGKQRIVKVGETSFYDRIQAAAYDCQIYNVIDQLERTGERVTDAQIAADAYVDTLAMPKSMMDLQQIRLEGKYFFDSLPAKVKAEKYGNSFEKFLADVNDGLKNKTIKTRDQIIQEQQAAKNPAPEA